MLYLSEPFGLCVPVRLNLLSCLSQLSVSHFPNLVFVWSTKWKPHHTLKLRESPLTHSPRVQKPLLTKMTAMRSFSSVLVALLVELETQTVTPENPASLPKPYRPTTLDPQVNSSLDAAFGRLIQWQRWEGKVNLCVDGDWLCVDIVHYFKGLLLFSTFLSADYLSCLSLVHSDLFIKAFQSSISHACPWTVSLFWASLPPFLPFLWLTLSEQ